MAEHYRSYRSYTTYRNRSYRTIFFLTPQAVLLKVSRMQISFSDRVQVPEGILISNLQDESVILNLDSERYFGLDNVGTRILTVLTNSDSIQSAYESLLAEYDVDHAVLRQDLLALIENLLQQGLVQVSA